MNLRTRLVLTLVAIIVLMAVPAIYASSRIVRLRMLVSQAQTNHGQAYLAVGELQTRLGEFDQLQRGYLATLDADQKTASDSALRNAVHNLDQLVARGYATRKGPAGRLLAELGGHAAEIDRLVRAGEKSAATEHFVSRVAPLLDTAQTRLRAISAAISKGAEADIRSASAVARTAISGTILFLVVALLLAIGLGAWITRNMVRPVTRLRLAMARVSGGDFQVPPDLPYGRRDEIGDVSRSFRGMTGRLAELETLRAEFMSISTHDLKTPINVIGGYAELLHDAVLGDVTPRQEEALDSIREQARVLTRMVNQLLDMSRIEAGGLRLEIADVVLADLFERVQRTYQALARKQDVTFTVELAADAPRVIPGDADRLRDQVLGNLLGNAFKFTPAGGRITVRGL
ncbi:MAG: HAMP domain-containing protein, partial [Gemmatimonadetes bacterium]|nr:HAMP domain-containing protein [Gemmatimonadota bacterium]